MSEIPYFKQQNFYLKCFLLYIKYNKSKGTHTTEQAKEPLWVWLSLIKKVPSFLPLSSFSASFRLIPPTYQLLSSWWVSSASVYGLEGGVGVLWLII